MDPHAGLIFDPASLHRYLYARDNGVDFSDPSGEMSFAGALTIGAIIGTIAGMAVGVTIANFRGLTIKEAEFWYWVGGGAIAGAVVGMIATWALIKFGVISVAYAGTTAPAVNWLADNAQRAWHTVRPEHLWERVVSLPAPNTVTNALQNYREILPAVENVVATTTPRAVQLANGAQKLIYEGTYAGQQIMVRIWVSPTGQRVIEDAWVVGP